MLRTIKVVNLFKSVPRAQVSLKCSCNTTSGSAPLYTQFYNFGSATSSTTRTNRSSLSTTQDTQGTPGTPDISKLRRKRTSHPKQLSINNNEEYEDEDLDIGDDEYIPEMDWDHTRFHDHYQRIWEEPKELPTLREKIYTVFLRMFSFTALSIAIGCVVFGSFIYLKMRKQLRHVNNTQKLLRKTRKIFDINKNMIPLSLDTMDVNNIKNQLLPYADNNGKLNINKLENECTLWKTLIDNGVDINVLSDWQNKGKKNKKNKNNNNDNNDNNNNELTISIEDTTYLLALMQYFMAQSRKKGTPSVRRQLRDDLYKMICSYNNNNNNIVTLSNMGSFANACFCLAILSPPNLGSEDLGGQNIDNFKINYVRYMLRDEELDENCQVPIRRFNFLYKVCDFSIGLTPESQGQLSK